MINTIQSFLKILKRRFFREIYLKSFKFNLQNFYLYLFHSKCFKNRTSLFSFLYKFLSNFIFLSINLYYSFALYFSLTLTLLIFLYLFLCFSLSSVVTLIYNLVSLYLSLSMAEVRSILWLYNVYCIFPFTSSIPKLTKGRSQIFNTKKMLIKLLLSS